MTLVPSDEVSLSFFRFVLLARTWLERGEHEIEKEMIFRSCPGLIFHDSRGFESGGVAELEKVKNFINQRAKERNLQNQLHVIW
jgi:hypothetical protein